MRFPNLNTTYKTVKADYVELPYYQDSSYSEIVQFRMKLFTENALVESEEETNFYDLFIAYFGFDASSYYGNVEILYVASDRGTDAGVLQEAYDEQKFRAIADTTILGKNFQDLIAAAPAFGASPDSKYSFLFQKMAGPVAFSLDDGTVFVFDRAE